MNLWAVRVLLLGSAVPSLAEVYNMTCPERSWTYHYDRLAGYTSIPGDFRDTTGDTLSMGSSIHITDWEPPSGNRANGTFTGTLWGLSDRGWNSRGTVNHQPRVHRFNLTFTPSRIEPLERLRVEYFDTFLLRDPEGGPTTGLTPDDEGGIQFPYFPLMPAATFVGDGFSKGDPKGRPVRRVALDPESLHVDTASSTLTVGDEYGPYIYTFSYTGRMITAVTPPRAFLPLRDNVTAFGTGDAPAADPNRTPPAWLETGRAPNRGFEGVTLSPTAKYMFAMLQSPLLQEGAADAPFGSPANQPPYARLLLYRRRGAADEEPVLSAQYLVPLPEYGPGDRRARTALQTEILWLSPRQVLMLTRADGEGRGGAATLRNDHRRIDVVDVSAATNLLDLDEDQAAHMFGPSGLLQLGDAVTAATVCPLIDLNEESSVGEYGLGSPEDPEANVLNEKWEGMAVVPGLGPDEYFVFAAADNDFVTQNGTIGGGKIPYQDPKGITLESQIMAFQVRLPSVVAE